MDLKYIDFVRKYGTALNTINNLSTNLNVTKKERLWWRLKLVFPILICLLQFLQGMREKFSINHSVMLSLIKSSCQNKHHLTKAMPKFPSWLTDCLFARKLYLFDYDCCIVISADYNWRSYNKPPIDFCSRHQTQTRELASTSKK